MEWLIIADDLTGACDTGGAFASGGMNTRVLLDFDGQASPAQVLVVTTESRHLTVQQAARAVKTALAANPIPGGCKIYKKIDSTLRGHPATELAAVMQSYSVDRALVCPAFPGQGRTVRGGRLYVHGALLAETVFGAEVADGQAADLERRFEIGPGSRLVPLALVRQGMEAVAAALSTHQGAVFVADSETESDLDVLARAASAAGLDLLCGSAGLARAITRVSGGAGEGFRGDSTAPVLVVAGSRHPSTAGQVEALEAAGCEVVRLQAGQLRMDTDDEGVVELANRRIRVGKDVVLSTTGLAYRPGEEAGIAHGLGRLAARVLKDAAPGGVVLTGGDIAAAVCRSMGCRAIDLGGEVLPGMVWGRLVDGGKPCLPVITKAGGFGDDQALIQAVHFLRLQGAERNL